MPVLDLTYSEGRRTQRRWRASNNTTNLWAMTYGYDADDNISTITDLVSAPASLTFQYDRVDRLTRTDRQTGTLRREDTVFDANGNRIRVERRTLATDVSPAATDTYTRTSGTNGLASIATAAGTRTLTHDARSNLSGETRPGSITATTTYLAMNERTATFTYHIDQPPSDPSLQRVAHPAHQSPQLQPG